MRFRKYITEAQRMTLKAAQRKKINKDLTNLTSPKYKTQYFKRIPLKDITDILKKHGIVLLQEDNTEWDIYYMDSNGRNTSGIHFLDGNSNGLVDGSEGEVYNWQYFTDGNESVTIAPPSSKTI